MLGYAGQRLALSEVQEDGASLEKHLMSWWRQSLPQYDPEQMPEQLKAVDCDEEVKYLWDYFQSMSVRRTSNGFSMNPIDHLQLEAWARQRNICLTPFEYQALDALEILYRNQQAKKKTPK